MVYVGGAFYLLAGTMYYVGIALAAFALVSAPFLWRTRNRFAWLLILSALTPLVLIMAIAPFQYTANRYIFFTLFSWLALAGMGIQLAAARFAKDARLLALIMAAVLIAGSMTDLFLYFSRQNGNRADWQAAFAYIAEHGRAGDHVVSSDLDVFAYYLGSPFVYQSWDAEQQPAASRTWYIVDLVVDELYPQQLARVEQQEQPVAIFDVHLPARTFPMRVYFVEAPEP